MNLKFTLQQARLVRRLSQKQLADRIGTDESSVRAWESGGRIVPTEFIGPLSYALRIPTDALSLP